MLTSRILVAVSSYRGIGASPGTTGSGAAISLLAPVAQSCEGSKLQVFLSCHGPPGTVHEPGNRDGPPHCLNRTVNRQIIGIKGFRGGAYCRFSAMQLTPGEYHLDSVTQKCGNWEDVWIAGNCQ
jgi:hypothetical protein